MIELKEGHPCGLHRGCLQHISHPCEGCGRIAGRDNPYIVVIPKYMYEVDKDWDIIHDDKRFIECLFKLVCGWSLGGTFSDFMVELKLAEWNCAEDNGELLIPTRFGKEFLYYYHNAGNYKSKFIYEGKDET